MDYHTLAISSDVQVFLLLYLSLVVMQALCRLSTTTNVLQQPNLLPQQAREAASRLALQSPPPTHSTSLSPPHHNRSPFQGPQLTPRLGAASAPTGIP